MPRYKKRGFRNRGNLPPSPNGTFRNRGNYPYHPNGTFRSSGKLSRQLNNAFRNYGKTLHDKKHDPHRIYSLPDNCRDGSFLRILTGKLHTFMQNYLFELQI